ncbi:MAG: hypothetical protein HC819_09585 [Cyclobacteriaceae bacterium]|nr:hypothetical protein [Cyclobacteriaceae bacterium]
MKQTDFNKEMTDYLYGELSAVERRAFEEKMQKDQQLKHEFEELKALRTQLQALTDKDVMEPFPIWGNRSATKKSGKGLILLRPVTAIAATLILLVMVGYLAGFTISMNRQGIMLGFGHLDTTSEAQLSDAHFKALVAQAIAENNNEILDKLNTRDSSFQEKFTALETSLYKVVKQDQSNTITDHDLEKFLEELERRNAELVRGYLTLSAAQQQAYFKTMLTQFNDFVQEQRSEDLALIQNNLIELKASQSIQKQKTDQVLASLISTINYNTKN